MKVIKATNPLDDTHTHNIVNEEGSASLGVYLLEDEACIELVVHIDITDNSKVTQSINDLRMWRGVLESNIGNDIHQEVDNDVNEDCDNTMGYLRVLGWINVETYNRIISEGISNDKKIITPECDQPAGIYGEDYGEFMGACDKCPFSVGCKKLTENEGNETE